MPAPNLLAVISYLFVISSASSRWHVAIVWVARILTLSLLLRTYIVPGVVAGISKHIRFRSISLRSLRGLYVRKGADVWRVERIAYRWSYIEGLNRFSITVDGLSVELGRMESATKPRRRHRRKLTLADFGPSPVARRTWKLVAQIYSALDPLVRPTIRALVAASLSRIIRWLPFITQRLTFDLNSAVITFKDLPGTQITTDKIHFQMSLGFSKLGNAADVPPPAESQRPAVMYSMSAWQSYFSSSLRRSWDRAWGRAEGTATVNIQITEVAGYTPSSLGSFEPRLLNS